MVVKNRRALASILSLAVLASAMPIVNVVADETGKSTVSTSQAVNYVKNLSVEDILYIAPTDEDNKSDWNKTVASKIAGIDYSKTLTPEEYADIVDIIKSNAGAYSEMVGQILDGCKADITYENGKLTVKASATDVQNAINTMIQDKVDEALGELKADAEEQGINFDNLKVTTDIDVAFTATVDTTTLEKESKVEVTYQANSGEKVYSLFGMADLVAEKLEAVKADFVAASDELIKQCNEKFDEAREDLEKADDQIADANKQLNDAQAKLDDARKTLDDARAEVKTAQDELDKAVAEGADTSAEQKKLDDAKKKLDEKETELNDAQKKLNDARAEFDAKIAEMTGNSSVQDLIDKVNDAAARLDDFSAEVDNVEALLDSLSETVTSAAEKVYSYKDIAVSAKADTAKEAYAEIYAQVQANDKIPAVVKENMPMNYDVVFENEKVVNAFTKFSNAITAEDVKAVLDSAREVTVSFENGMLTFSCKVDDAEVENSEKLVTIEVGAVDIALESEKSVGTFFMEIERLKKEITTDETTTPTPDETTGNSSDSTPDESTPDESTPDESTPDESTGSDETTTSAESIGPDETTTPEDTKTPEDTTTPDETDITDDTRSLWDRVWAGDENCKAGVLGNVVNKDPEFNPADATDDMPDAGTLNAIDALEILKKVVEVEGVEFSTFDNVVADVSFNGEIDSTDALGVLQYVVEIIDAYPDEAGNSAIYVAVEFDVADKTKIIKREYYKKDLTIVPVKYTSLK